MAKDGKAWRWVDRKNSNFPWYLFTTQKSKQIAAFRVHPADAVNSYMEMEVRDRRIGPKQMLGAGKSYYLGRYGVPLKLRHRHFRNQQWHQAWHDPARDR